MRQPPTASVIICCYTFDRWALLLKAIESVYRQQTPAHEIIICVDHNDELLADLEKYLERYADTTPPITVVANKYEGRLGSARNTAAELANGEVLAFLDDDAAASPTWLSRLIDPYLNDRVVAVGGAPVPDMARPRPAWLPLEFDWVFGCVYEGLPKSVGPVRRLIGASMSVRRDALVKIGGFHSDNHDDMDMCHRLTWTFPDALILFQPESVVHHHVPAGRLTWHYYWTRCFSVNRSKVTALENMRDAGSMSAEREFALNMLKNGATREARNVLSGDLDGALRIAAMVGGMSAAAAGFALGTAERWRQTRLSAGGERRH
jgi:cellulose synthase/poly-beta-1,6-N-acetylglucosamine synthase-like glycosyltransferase